MGFHILPLLYLHCPFSTQLFLNMYVSGDKFSTDWDKAWSNFRKQSKKTFFSGFSPNKYVTWNPRKSDYPLSEEVDPIKRTERSNLRLWTSPGFTLVGAIIIVSFLLLYTILAPVKWSIFSLWRMQLVYCKRIIVRKRVNIVKPEFCKWTQILIVFFSLFVFPTNTSMTILVL